MAGFLGDWDFIWRLRVGCWNWLIQIWWKERGDPFVCRHLPTYPYPWLISAQAHIPSGLKVCFWTCCGKSALQIWLVNLKLLFLQAQPPVFWLRSGTAKSNGDVLFLACFTTGKWFLPTLSGARGGGSWELQPWGHLLSVNIRVTYLPKTPFLSFPSWPPSLGPIFPSIHCAD